MNLWDIVDNSKTDKNTLHSYLGLYQKLLISKKETAKNVLEIGINQGGSIKLWYDFFPNATIYGLDIIKIKDMWSEIRNKTRIRLGRFDAYDENFVNNNFLNKDIRFDFMLDDGPHTLESMKQFIKLYTPLMTYDGILIIEDIQTWDWIEILKNEVPEDLKKFINVYDLRENKNRYDDIVFTIDKTFINNNNVQVEEYVSEVQLEDSHSETVEDIVYDEEVQLEDSHSETPVEDIVYDEEVQLEDSQSETHIEDIVYDEEVQLEDSHSETHVEE